MILQLTKQSTDQEIKAYFEEVLRMSRDSEELFVVDKKSSDDADTTENPLNPLKRCKENNKSAFYSK